MGWERRGAYQYYIRKEQQDGRTVRRSLGRGPAAMAAAAADAARRQAQEHAYAARLHLTTLEQQSDQVSRLIVQLMQATLLVAGYHQHHRSAWRQRHDHR